MSVCFARIHPPPPPPPMETKPQPSYPVDKAPFRIVITKVRYLIKRKYDQIMVFNYIFVQQFFFLSSILLRTIQFYHLKE